MKTKKQKNLLSATAADEPNDTHLERSGSSPPELSRNEFERIPPFLNHPGNMTEEELLSLCILLGHVKL